MLHKSIISAAIAVAVVRSSAGAQSLATSDHPPLHVNPRWEECSFQLDPALTQRAWAQFTREAGLVVYFRSLADARPMGRGKFELSLLQWKTGIDDADPAWNDTFVHPDSTHHLFEGSGLKFPGLTARVGVTDKTDVGVYVTKNPRANYGFAGAQVQRNVINDTKHNLYGAARLSAVGMYGPADLNFGVAGMEVLVSYQKKLTRWASVSPYIGAANYASYAHEKSAVVDLDDETQTGGQILVGAALQVSALRLSAEYANASVKSVSFKVGMGR